MTDAEKMLEMMLMLGAEASNNFETQFNNFAVMIKKMYDSFINAGFSEKTALELTKEVIRMSSKTK